MSPVLYILYALLAVLMVFLVLIVVSDIINLATKFQELTVSAVGTISSFGQQLASFAVFVGEQMATVTTLVGNALQQIASQLVAGFTRIETETADFLSFMLDEISRGLASVVDLLGDLANSLYSTIAQFGTRIFNILGDITGFLIQYIVPPLAIGLAGLVSLLVAIIEFFINFIVIPFFVPAFQGIVIGIKELIHLGQDIKTVGHSVYEFLTGGGLAQVLGNLGSNALSGFGSSIGLSF